MANRKLCCGDLNGWERSRANKAIIRVVHRQRPFFYYNASEDTFDLRFCVYFWLFFI